MRSTAFFTSSVSFHVSTMALMPASSSCCAMSSIMVMHTSGARAIVASMSMPSAVSSTGLPFIWGANWYCMAHLSFFVKLAGMSLAMRSPLPMHSTNALSTPTDPNVATLSMFTGSSTVRPAISVIVRVCGSCGSAAAGSLAGSLAADVPASPAEHPVKPTQASAAISSALIAEASQRFLLVVLIGIPSSWLGLSPARRRAESSLRRATGYRF